MKKHDLVKQIIILVVFLALVSGCYLSEPSNHTVDGWAVLAEKDEYEPPHADLMVEYINIARMRQALEKSGWDPGHIHDLREFERETLEAELDWLEDSADENDIVILYVASHGDYLSGEVIWHEFFAEEWAQIPSQRRLLHVQACKAENFIDDLADDPEPHLSVAAVARNELAWAGLEEEGLPIIGGVFTYYFTGALDDPAADEDGNGLVSVQEAAQLADEQQREYMQDVVLAVPEFVEMYHQAFYYPEKDPTYPHVIVDDAIGEPFYLAPDAQPDNSS